MPEVNLREKKQHVYALFEAEQRAAKKAAEIGFRFLLAPARTQAYLETLGVPALSWATQNMDQFTGTLIRAQQTDTDPWDDRAFLALSMKYAKLSFPRDFYDCLSPSLVVEGYDMCRRQTFRNLFFMEVSSYSLLEVTTHEWPMLFHRDQAITDLIIKQAEVDMWAENKTIESGIPKHFIRELLSARPQIFEVQQRNFAPLFAGPNQPGGILVVSYGRLLGVDKEIDRGAISFIN